MTDSDGLDYKDVAAIVRGALSFGRLRFHPKALMFKSSKTGKIDQFASDDVCEIQWMKASRGHQIVVLTNSNTITKFVGLEEKNKEDIKRFLEDNYKCSFVEKEPFIKGWNWGKVAFNGPLMTFHNDDKPMFQVPLSDVSASTVNKNEVTVEFHQDDDNDLCLVEMRFYVSNAGNEEDVPADLFQKNVMKYADVIKATGDSIVKFEQVNIQTPRGRYDVDMYPTFLRLHGKSYDYKIPYRTMIKLFLLPHNDQRSVYFVITTDPPIRQGQTRYPHIVIQFIKDDWSDLTLELDDETLATKYEGKLQKEMAGPTYEMFSKVMKFVVGQKIFVPGNFVSSRNTQAITCSHKANSGYLYPLERGFMFVVKPPVYIRFDEISSVNFSRVASVAQVRSFDLEIETKSGVGYNFVSIEKKEYTKLFDFLKSKKIRIQNTGGDDDGMGDDFGGNSGSDNEMPDHYLEKMKAEANERDSDDSESEDEDFVAGETPDSSPSSSPSEDGEGGSEGKKKKLKKKVVKETEIRSGEGGAKKPKQPRKEKKGKKERDPNRPKKPGTAYFQWMNANRPNIKEKYPDFSITEIAKKAGEMWRNMDPASEERKKYDDIYKKAMAKYEVDLGEYNRELARNPPPPSVGSSSPPNKKKKPTSAAPSASSGQYKSKETINTDDDLSSDSGSDSKKSKPKVKKEPKGEPIDDKKRKRESSDSHDSDVKAPDEDSDSSEGGKKPPPKRSMRSKGAPTSAPDNLPDDTFGDEEFTDGEAPVSASSSDEGSD